MKMSLLERLNPIISEDNLHVLRLEWGAEVVVEPPILYSSSVPTVEEQAPEAAVVPPPPLALVGSVLATGLAPSASAAPARLSFNLLNFRKIASQTQWCEV